MMDHLPLFSMNQLCKLQIKDYIEYDKMIRVLPGTGGDILIFVFLLVREAQRSYKELNIIFVSKSNCCV